MFVSSLNTSKIRELPLLLLFWISFRKFWILFKEFVNQLGVSKTLALMSSFPHKLVHYHADFQCFVTVINTVLLQGVFICLPQLKCVCVCVCVNKRKKIKWHIDIPVHWCSKPSAFFVLEELWVQYLFVSFVRMHLFCLAVGEKKYPESGSANYIQET